MKVKKALVVLSGGLDSAVAGKIARENVGEFGEIYTISFLYGQKHIKEIQSAYFISKAELKSVNHEDVIINLPKSYKATALTGDKQIPTDGYRDKVPSTWVPQRNSIFLAFAFGHAEIMGIDQVYTGFTSVDYSGYPDCRPIYVEAMNKALNLASAQFVEIGKGINIIAPLMGMSKVDIIRKGLELDLDFSLTWSCYQGREKACGVCDSCRFRLKAFEEVGIEDPIEYEKEI